MQLGALLRAEGLDLSEVAVMFHVSDKPALHRALPMLATEEPDLFDAFQNQHGPSVEATLKARGFMLSFVALPEGDFGLVGLYAIAGWTWASMAELDADSRRKELQRRFGDTVFVELGAIKGQNGRAVFDLVQRPEMATLIGRLRVRKPPKAPRNYRFLAETLDCPVLEITRTAQMIPPPPDWREFIVTTGDLRSIPRDWAARLREWRGIYLVTDQSDGARYVGSVWGKDNLLGRWQAHVAGDTGITAELSARDPRHFRFSILERVNPDLEKDTVIALEQSWKRRLDTQNHGLNRN